MGRYYKGSGGLSNDQDRVYGDWLDYKSALHTHYPHVIRVNMEGVPLTHYTLEMNALGIPSDAWSRLEEWDDIVMIFGFTEEEYLVRFKLRFADQVKQPKTYQR